MKINLYLNILLGLFVSLTAAVGDVAYQEVFPNPGADAPLANINWNANVGSSGTAFTGSTWSQGPILSSGDFIFFRPATGSGGPSFLVWTEEPDVSAIGSIANVTDVNMVLRNGSAAENIKVAIRVGSAWYVSQDVLNSPTESSTAVSLDVKSSGWNSLNFVAGTTLAEGGSVTLPSSGTVTAVGIFDASTNEGLAIRISDYTVETVPEPAAFGMFLVGSSGLFFVRKWLTR